MSSTAPPPSVRISVEDDRTGMHPVVLRRAFNDHVQFSRSRDIDGATTFDRYVALALSVRDRLVQRWVATQRHYYQRESKRAYYLSAEFLLGRALSANLQALGVYDEYRTVLADLGIDLAELVEQEPDAGLGNGGLGRLAACFLESMATLGLPGHGYGIRYEFGIFDQVIRNGYQIERADEWLRFGNPWEIERPEYTVPVGFGGYTKNMPDGHGGYRIVWEPSQQVVGVPYDTPVAGFRNNTVNSLRLWAARAGREFDFSLFNAGDYLRAVEQKNASEVISKVLYPNDNFESGRELRLQQEYFFVACSIHDIVWRFKRSKRSYEQFADHVAIQLNDTHPAIAIAELMRVLVDEEGVRWEVAWEQTVSAFGYTNHTLLPEALETWPVELFERLLPRHLEIIYELNRRFIREIMDAFPQDSNRVGRMSIIEEKPVKRIRMAHLAVVGSHSVNGVAQLHSELVRTNLLRDFAELYPERFNNKTNGVTPRRWILGCNPELSALITENLGSEDWVTDLDRLRDLEPLLEDPDFLHQLAEVKRHNKEALASLVEHELELQVDPQSLFDCQIKRLHEYKRQLLAALHAVALYLRHKRGEDVLPRTLVFGAKAAPGYQRAKLIIKLIHAIGYVINGDRKNDRIRVAFMPNYRVTLAERIIPAADLSEQISTAGMEASGTGNMKLAMNGALTIGTLDGANIEIRDAVGEENFFLFGLTADEVQQARAARITGRATYEVDEELREVVDLIQSGFFCPEERALFKPIMDACLDYDQYMVLHDFPAYAARQREVEQAFRVHDEWFKKAGYNITRMGRFSSDRTVSEYAEQIWGVEPVPVESPAPPSRIPTPSSMIPR